MSDKQRYLRQLTIDELRQLAKSKSLSLPDSFKKKQLVDFLALNVTKKDIDDFIKPKTKAKTAEGLGFEAQLKGKRLEDKVAAIFTRKGFSCTKNIRVPGAEFDVVGQKKVGWFSHDQWIFVECKNKSKVIPQDFKKFLGNFNLYKSRQKIDDTDIVGYLYTTGVFDPEVKSQARLINNVQLRRINLK